MEKSNRVLSIHGTRANHALHGSLFMLEYYVRLFDAGQGRSNCSSKLIGLVYSTHVFGVHVNAVFFLRCIHPVRLQCDKWEIYDYFSRTCTNTCAVCTRPYFFVGGLRTRLGPVSQQKTKIIILGIPSNTNVYRNIHCMR